MNNITIKISSFLLIVITVLLVPACDEGDLNIPPTQAPISDDPLDQYIQENFVKEYGIAVRYKFVDRYIDPDKRVTQPKREVIIPMLDFLTDFWIEPFSSVPNGEKFFRRYVPAEMVFIGSPIFNNDGTITLGTADAGARITLTQVNNYDLADKDWIITQIHTIYHEFAHIVHQNYNLPTNWKQISPKGYTSSGSWYTLEDEQALERGFVTPYATSSFNEDFAETAASILYDEDFYSKYTIDETNCADAACEARNEGRALIRKKYDAVRAHYTQYTGVDLLAVREIIQQKLQ
jgi:substrate import-associated zinc metallohydrolase lipoprotein